MNCKYDKDVFFKDENEMYNCKVCKLKMKQIKRHTHTQRHQKNLLKQKEEEQTIIVDTDSTVEIVEADKQEELVEVKLPKKKFRIVIEKNYNIFQSKIEKYLENGWKLHGYTQHPFQVSRQIDDKTAIKGQWSQAFTKNIF